jgi:hypothetical protein
VALIAGALGVTPELFRDAFSRVRPAPAGREPSPAQVRQNKEALMKALAPHGITNERLDTVSNYYRYDRGRGEMWPTRTPIAYAYVQNGVVVRFEVADGGSGFNSPPIIRVPGCANVTARIEIGWDKKPERNGSVRAITVPVAKAR